MRFKEKCQNFKKLIIFMELTETLIRLIQINTKERIDIIGNNFVYAINKSLAVAISPIFFKIINDNPTVKEIFLPIDEDFEDFFKGKSINKELFLQMSILLENKELIRKWKEENKINKENLIAYLKKFIKYKGKTEYIKEEIEFIGEHFEEIEVDNKIKIEEIPSEYLSEIMKTVKGIETEEKIYKYIIKRLKEEEEESSRKKLIESIEIRGLNNKDIKELIENIRYEDLSGKLKI